MTENEDWSTRLMPEGYEPRFLTHYVVVRRAPDLPDDFNIGDYDGKWIERPDIGYPTDERLRAGTMGVAVSTGRYEMRWDGVIAEVFEIRP